MRIGLAYNETPDPAPDAASDSASDAFAEWDDPSTIAAVEQALGLFGSVIRLEADQFFPQNLVLARPVPARALRRARAGRDVPPGPRVHRRDPRERPGGLLPAGDRIRFLGPARGRAAGVRLRGEVGVGPP